MIPTSRSSCRRITRSPSVSHADGSVRFDGEHVMPQLIPAHGGSLPEPDKEDVTGRVLVAVVLGTTFRAIPMSHSEPVLTCRA
jgi:hypothetical protein